MSNKLKQAEVQKRIRDTFAQNVELISDYVNKRGSITLKCNDCGHVWETIAQNVLYGNVKAHQCPKCGTITSRKKLLSCANCGKEFWRTQSEIKRTKADIFIVVESVAINIKIK